MTGEEATKLLVHEVPKIPGSEITKATPAYSGSDFGNLLLKRDYLDAYTRKEIELPESISTPVNHSFTLCSNFQQDLCCDFGIEVVLRSVSANSVRNLWCINFNFYILILNTYVPGILHVLCCCFQWCSNFWWLRLWWNSNLCCHCMSK